MDLNLGPPVCMKCCIIATFYENRPAYPWQCSVCGDLNCNASLYLYTPHQIALIRARTELLMDHTESRLGPYSIKICRPFMNNGLDPNRYRKWLESTVGKQGKDWNWELRLTTIDEVCIVFLREPDAVLFELSCH